jgi:hypothetical protein
MEREGAWHRRPVYTSGMPANTSRVTQVLRDALAAVAAADIPPELQPTALEKAVDLLAATPASSPVAHDKHDEPRAGATKPLGASPLDKIAENLKLSREIVGDAFHYDDEAGLQVGLGTTKFASAKSAGAKQLALLFAAGRQAAGIEEWTAMKDLRELAKDFGRFDSANYSATIKEMHDVFMFAGTNAMDRKVKVNRRGKEAAAALITKMTGGESA